MYEFHCRFLTGNSVPSNFNEKSISSSHWRLAFQQLSGMAISSTIAPSDVALFGTAAAAGTSAAVTRRRRSAKSARKPVLPSIEPPPTHPDRRARDNLMSQPQKIRFDPNKALCDYTEAEQLDLSPNQKYDAWDAQQRAQRSGVAAGGAGAENELGSRCVFVCSSPHHDVLYFFYERSDLFKTITYTTTVAKRQSETLTMLTSPPPSLSPQAPPRQRSARRHPRLLLSRPRRRLRRSLPRQRRARWHPRLLLTRPRRRRSLPL